MKALKETEEWKALNEVMAPIITGLFKKLKTHGLGGTDTEFIRGQIEGIEMVLLRPKQFLEDARQKLAGVKR